MAETMIRTNLPRRSRQMHDAALQGRNGGLRAVADIKAAENDVDVPFDRRLADAESFADLPIAAALDDQFQHFHLTRAQLRMRRAFRQTLGDRWRNVLKPGVNRARSEERRVGKECRSRWSPEE